MKRRTWLIRTGAALLGVACAPLESLADWHAGHLSRPHLTLRQQTLFVNSAVPWRGGPGPSWETAFASLQDALDTITSPGTTILIASNHVEHLTGPIVVPAHGAGIIGLSDGYMRPTFIFDDAHRD